MTPFTRSVYAVVSAIPSGCVTTYGMVASMVGRPRAPRAVGGALSGLPKELGVPWWRVISSSGKISTSPIHHTAQIQRAMLEDEGVRFSESGRIDWNRYEWNPNEAESEQALAAADVEASQTEGTRKGSRMGTPTGSPI
jgi:methylated-DNA-protein-cysteine methyltransferase-like protein